jgi:hypothetical protein
MKYHQQTCSRAKKRLASALAKAKEVWNNRKKRRIEPVERDHQDNVAVQDSNSRLDDRHQPMVHDTRAVCHLSYTEVLSIQITWRIF